MIYTLTQIRSGTGFPRGSRFVPLDDAKAACDPDALEAIADEIDCFEHSARAHSLRIIAKKQRALLEGHK